MGKNGKLTLLDPLKLHLHKFFTLVSSFLHLISNGLNRVNVNSLMLILALLQIFV